MAKNLLENGPSEGELVVAVVREVKQGERKGSQFLGCSSYPRCRFTKEIKQESGRSWTRTIIAVLIVLGIIWWVLS